ncbi:MAG: hypothetical protein AAFX99_20260, partial [Myxococcota bacterium]
MKPLKPHNGRHSRPIDTALGKRNGYSIAPHSSADRSSIVLTRHPQRSVLKKPTDTNGVLQVGFGGAFPIVSDSAGTYMAAATLGEGR